MNVTLDCECGRSIPFTEGAASLRFSCACGRPVVVPSLGELRDRGGQPAVPKDPVAEVALGLSGGSLLPKECVCCGRTDAEPIEQLAICERRHLQRGDTDDSGPPMLSFLLFGWIGMLASVLFRRQSAESEWHGRDTTVPMPLPLCDLCRADTGVDALLAVGRGKSLRDVASRVAAYDAVLKKYPDAVLQRQRKRLTTVGGLRQRERSMETDAVIAASPVDDGVFPNSVLPVLVYKNAVQVLEADPASAFACCFESNGWGGTWRNGIYGYHHYHATAHEVLGIARGSVKTHLGGPKGRLFDLSAGDVVVLPAGVSHKNVEASDDLLVVGAYPWGQEADMNYGRPGERPATDEKIARVSLPETDPVHGRGGPLISCWSRAIG